MQYSLDIVSKFFFWGEGGDDMLIKFAVKIAIDSIVIINMGTINSWDRNFIHESRGEKGKNFQLYGSYI